MKSGVYEWLMMETKLLFAYAKLVADQSFRKSDVLVTRVQKRNRALSIHAIDVERSSQNPLNAVTYIGSRLKADHALRFARESLENCAGKFCFETN